MIGKLCEIVMEHFESQQFEKNYSNSLKQIVIFGLWKETILKDNNSGD